MCHMSVPSQELIVVIGLPNNYVYICKLTSICFKLFLHLSWLCAVVDFVCFLSYVLLLMKVFAGILPRYLFPQNYFCLFVNRLIRLEWFLFDIWIYHDIAFLDFLLTTCWGNWYYTKLAFYLELMSNILRI